MLYIFQIYLSHLIKEDQGTIYKKKRAPCKRERPPPNRGVGVDMGMVRRKKGKNDGKALGATHYDMHYIYDERIRCGASP